MSKEILPTKTGHTSFLLGGSFFFSVCGFTTSKGGKWPIGNSPGMLGMPGIGMLMPGMEGMPMSKFMGTPGPPTPGGGGTMGMPGGTGGRPNGKPGGIGGMPGMPPGGPGSVGSVPGSVKGAGTVPMAPGKVPISSGGALGRGRLGAPGGADMTEAQWLQTIRFSHIHSSALAALRRWHKIWAPVAGAEAATIRTDSLASAKMKAASLRSQATRGLQTQ